MIILFNQNIVILHQCQYVCLISEKKKKIGKKESMKMEM